MLWHPVNFTSFYFHISICMKKTGLFPLFSSHCITKNKLFPPCMLLTKLLKSAHSLFGYYHVINNDLQPLSHQATFHSHQTTVSGSNSQAATLLSSSIREKQTREKDVLFSFSYYPLLSLSLSTRMGVALIQSLPGNMHCCESGSSVWGTGAVSGLLAGCKRFDTNAGNWFPTSPLLLLLFTGTIGLLLKVCRGQLQSILYLVPCLCWNKGKNMVMILSLLKWCADKKDKRLKILYFLVMLYLLKCFVTAALWHWHISNARLFNCCTINEVCNNLFYYYNLTYNKPSI